MSMKSAHKMPSTFTIVCTLLSQKSSNCLFQMSQDFLVFPALSCWWPSFSWKKPFTVPL